MTFFHEFVTFLRTLVGPWGKMRSLLPISSNRLIVRDTVDGSISRNRAISRTPFPFSCALIMAGLNSFILTLKTKFEMKFVEKTMKTQQKKSSVAVSSITLY